MYWDDLLMALHGLLGNRVPVLWVLLIGLAVSVAGCSRAPEGLSTPGVDAESAAARAIELYDANGDGLLSGDELAKCQPLAASLANFDANGDGQLAAEELTNRLAQLAGPTSAYVSAACTVTLDGRPLAGATVKLRPLDAFEGELHPAEGTTNESGVATVGIASNLLPNNLAQTPLVFPGLYHVEITHPDIQLPERYNTATELGCEVNPAARGGTSLLFHLKSS